MDFVLRSPSDRVIQQKFSKETTQIEYVPPEAGKLMDFVLRSPSDRVIQQKFSKETTQIEYVPPEAGNKTSSGVRQIEYYNRSSPKRRHK